VNKSAANESLAHVDVRPLEATCAWPLCVPGYFLALPKIVFLTFFDLGIGVNPLLLVVLVHPWSSGRGPWLCKAFS
jgi:hypothetical protein